MTPRLRTLEQFDAKTELSIVLIQQAIFSTEYDLELLLIVFRRITMLLLSVSL